MPKSIAFFNNKGGVGKTTLACNFAHFLTTHGKNTLLVDCDPQTKATQLVLDESQWNDIYLPTNNELDSAARTQSVYGLFTRILRRYAEISYEVNIVHSNRFNVDVLPGHPKLALVEDRLSTAWTELMGGNAAGVAGATTTAWTSHFNHSEMASTYDYIIYDLSPSLGALNRSILIGSSGFVTPLGTDMFSLHAIHNIHDWLSDIRRDYNDAYKRIPKTDREEEEIPTPEEASPAWLGYSTQQYVHRNTNGEPVAAYERFKERIRTDSKLLEDFAHKSIPRPDMASSNTYFLGNIPYMFSMPNLAHESHAPIATLTTADGLRGAQFSQRDKYVNLLNGAFANLQNAIEGNDE